MPVLAHALRGENPSAGSSAGALAAGPHHIDGRRLPERQAVYIPPKPGMWQRFSIECKSHDARLTIAR